ncbi:MAG: serine/threonine-protein phosphatase [Actinomycetota bacterium]|nr:serine/threonine-protein phosphatase [Actinomycetota bacterium]
MPHSGPTDLDACFGRMVEEVLRRTHLSAPSELARVFSEEARVAGIEALSVYLIDYEQRTLVPVPSPDSAGKEPLPVQGSLAGRCFATTSTVETEADGERGHRLWLPLVDGTERVGTMEVSFPPGDPVVSREFVAFWERMAHLAALLLSSKSLYTDYFERLRRRQEMTTASELLWELVPPMVFASDGFVLAALLEPCYDMGGDSFDYALNEGVLHLGVFDAMGHGLRAAGSAAFALSVYRTSRRRGDSLADTYAAIDAALWEQYQASRFVTALIAELDIASGELRCISAGHPAPLLLREGRVTKGLDPEPVPPLGVQLAAGAPNVAHISLQPGDMVLLYTDGLTEARRPGGELFTVERLGAFIEREAASAQGAPETLRRLREAIIGREEGSLHDDATAVLVEWRRGTEESVVPETVLE